MNQSVEQMKKSSSPVPSRWSRWFQHLKPTTYRRHFGASDRTALHDVIKAAEHGHRGEIRLVVEAKLPLSLILDQVSPRQRAISWFSDLRVWDTEGNTGILLYLLLAEHTLEIVADRGIAGKVPQQEWDAVSLQLQQDLASGNVQAGISQAVKRLGELLALHFPITAGEINPNELSNEPVILV